MSIHYDHDEKGRRISERQTVHHPETGEQLWAHEVKQGYSEQGLANRQTPDGLPPVEWLTYGSGHLAGMKLGDTPLVEYTRDRLHREVQRRFGPDTQADEYELTSTYTAGGRLASQHLTLPQLNREYGYDEGGHLIRIREAQQSWAYRYSDTGRLTAVRTTATDLDMTIPYATDPAGNRLPDPELSPESTLTCWPDNRIGEDAQYVYRYDRHGRLTEKTDRIPEGGNRMYDERTHRYSYDNQHRLVHYVRTQYHQTQAEGRYLYDALGRRVGKQVWKREREHSAYEQMALSRRPSVTWYGWEGDRLATVQTAQNRIQTVYSPGSFTPLVRIETPNAAREKARHRSLVEVLQQEGSEDGQGVVFPAELVRMLDRLESEIRQNAVSEANWAWLAGCGLTVEQMAAQMEEAPEPQRKIHLYHCDHRGLPLALVDTDNQVAWSAGYDEWGNMLREENPQGLEQLIRLPGQQYDEESGLYYNRNRYYNPGLGRYITQDPIGLEGGWNLYQYPLDPILGVDPLGLDEFNLSAGITQVGMSNQTASTGLSSDQAEIAMKHNATTEGAWTPGNDYVKLWGIETPIIVFTTVTGPGSSISMLREGTLTIKTIIKEAILSCTSTAIYQKIEKGAVNASDVVLSFIIGGLTAEKNFLNSVAIATGISQMGNEGSGTAAIGGAMVKGADLLTGKIYRFLRASPYLSLATGIFGEGVGDKTTSELNNKDGK